MSVDVKVKQRDTSSIVEDETMSSLDDTMTSQSTNSEEGDLPKVIGRVNMRFWEGQQSSSASTVSLFLFLPSSNIFD